MTAVKWISLNEAGRRIGEGHHRARLTDHEIDLVRQCREDGMGYDEIASKFEISRDSAKSICTYRRRAQITARFKRIDPAESAAPQ